MTTENTFKGFSQETLTFLKTVREKNSKDWFENNRSRYDQVLLTPLKNLVTDLTPFIQQIDADIEVRPAINKTISKIFRDTRFSKDKSLFKQSMWIVFKRPRKDWKGRPGYFFEIFPDWYRYGMGFYDAPPDMMARFRETIDEKSSSFEQVISFFNDNCPFVLEGDLYKRTIPNDHDQSIQTWYQRKNFYLVANREIDGLLFESKLVNVLIEEFELLIPLYNFLLGL